MNDKAPRPEKTANVNILGSELLPTPAEIKAELVLSPRAEATVLGARKAVQDILDGKDKRVFAVVGPCSIHDVKAAREYATKLSGLQKKVEGSIFILMRAYFEKPRTTTGWKGLINDPDMDDTFDVAKGLRTARRLLLELNEQGLPAATEALDPIVPQYIADLISWSAIGARTSESQTHRELASGLSMPVGFKNGTDGSIGIAMNGMKSALSSHHFVGITPEGRVARFQTAGNRYGHIVLRGGNSKPNFDPDSVAAVTKELDKNGLRKALVVDCSHDNSRKDHRNQPAVLESVAAQVAAGNRNVVGFMLESHLHEGNQSITEDLSKLKYGVSVTDKCLDWESTEKAILSAASRIKKS